MTVPYWRLSSFYLCYFATLGAFIPYWSLFLKENDFNSTQIGQLSALLVGTKIIAPNFWGWIADYTRKNLHIIRWTLFFSTVLFAGFWSALGYWAFAGLTIVFSFFWNAPLPLYEATTLSHLKSEPHRYSRVRLWGSVGFILTVTAIGRLLDTQPIRLLPVAITGLLALNWLTTLITPPSRVAHPDSNTTRLSKIVKQPEVIAFLVVYVLIQFAHAPYYVFYSIYLEQHLYSTTTTGMLWSLGVIAEIGLFLVMRSVLQRYSLRQILLVSLIFAVIRWELIGSYVDNIGLLLCAQLLHAATFGGAHIAAIHFIHRYFDECHQSKGQALYHSLSFGLGGMLGSITSGYYWEVLGSHMIFSVAGLSCALAWLIAYLWVGR